MNNDFALAALAILDDETSPVVDNARHVLATLWNAVQALPEEQAEAASQQLLAVFEDVQNLHTICQDRAQILQDAGTALIATINELRSQRNAALDDLQSVRRSAHDQARSDIARDLALELDISANDARRLLNAIVGNPDVAVSGYTMMDLRDNLRCLLSEITDELVCSGADETEYWRD